ncbi:MAG: DUF6807 domain-containing protein [Acidimicrobiia bacterium]
MIAEDQGFFGAELFVDDSRFLVHHTDFVALGYYFRGASNKPFLASVVGPSGRNMVDAQPSDHAHHRGIWWGHGDVNGVDYYLEVPKVGGDHPIGTIVHLGFDDIIDASPAFGFVEQLEWREPSGMVAIRERRSLAIDLSRGDRYTLDLESTYTAVIDLVLGDTKESTLPGVRLAERLTVNGGGRMVNSRGGVGEAECFGQPAEWVDHSVSRNGVYWREYTEGIAIFDHPDNPHHPAMWFTRDYGPQSPFEGHHFIGAGTMAAGDELRLRHRILVHEGDTEAADVAGAYAEYAGEAANGSDREGAS